MNESLRPMPVATDATRPFWDAASRHTLVIQRCSHCGRQQFPPRSFCHYCMSTEVTWQECSGRGTVYTFTVNYRAANAHMANRTPYVVAVISLDEGVRMFTNIVESSPDAVCLGARVEVCWLDTPGLPTLPQFRLLPSGTSPAIRHGEQR